MPDAQYENSRRYLPAFCWAWNTTVSESLSVRPFEVMTGAQPRGTADAVLPRTPDPDARVQIDEIRVSAREFVRIAADHADYMRAQRRDMLNRHGRLLRNLDVGQHVKIFMPPAQGEVKRRGRKKKHLLRWKGPLEIVARPGNTTFKLRSVAGKIYMRHLANVRPWRGPLPSGNTATELTLPPSDVENIVPGEFVFASDVPGADVYHLLKIKEATDLDITAQVYGTAGKNYHTAKYTPVYTRGSDIILSRYSRVKGAKPWTWTILIDDIEDMVLAQGLIVSTQGKLSAKTRRIVTQLKPRTLKTFE